MKIVCLSLLAAVLFFSCSKNDDDVITSGETDFSVYLTDDPGEYDKVYIDIQSVEVHYSDDSGDAWHTLKMFSPGVHDLLKLTNGKDTLLARERIASKKITQIRLILGNNNTVVVDGVTYPLETPSAQQSGLKLNVDIILTPGVEYAIWTDFDASKSIVVTGNNKYMLKPVIRVYTKAVSGSIGGIVLPPEAEAWVYALNGSDTIASVKPDAVTGKFLINGLAAGSYDISIDGNNNFNDIIYTGVQVSVGNLTETGTSILHQ
jgi:hypothetical protein